MRFKKLKISNIRSYKEQEIEFPDGSLLLAGDVGAGKTSILLALEYALFGLQPSQKGNSLLRNDSNVGEVELEFELQGKQIVVKRKLKRTTKGVSNEYAILKINDVKTESSVTEIKSMIISELGYPPEFVRKNNILYRYTVYTPQEQMKQIILEDPETRLDILRHIFGIDKYKNVKNNLAILISNLKSESKILYGESSSIEIDKGNLNKCQNKIFFVQEKIEKCEQEFFALKQKRKEIEKELLELKEKTEEKRLFEKEVEKTSIMIVTKKENISSLIDEINDLNKNIESEYLTFNDQEYTSLAETLKKSREKLEILNSKKLEVFSKFNALEKERKEILQKKERIFKIDVCPTCLQDVPESHKHNILNEIESKLYKINGETLFLNNEVSDVSKKIELEKNLLEDLQIKKTKLEIFKSKFSLIEKSKQKIIELIKKKSLYEEDIRMLSNHSNSLKEKILSYSIYGNKFNLKNEELSKAFNQEKKAEISLAEEKKELEITKREISFYEEIIQRKTDAIKKLKKLNELIEWLSNDFLRLIEIIETNVLLMLRKEFSSLFRKWFLMLVPENSLDTQIDENFTPITMQGESEMSYDSLSGGERTAVALAYRLALNQTINSLMSQIKTRGIIILDEPTDGFSETQINKIRDILEELNAEQLIIVSHEQKIESFVDNVLRVMKNGDASYIEQYLHQKT